MPDQSAFFDVAPKRWSSACLPPGVGPVSVAGGYRGARNGDDIDIVATAGDGAPIIAHFIDYENIRKVAATGQTKATVILRDALQVDLRVVPEKSYGATLVYFSGSKARNIAIRQLGQQRGLKINEFALFRSARRIAGQYEKSVYRALGLSEIPPELRVDRGEIDVGAAGDLSTLVERRDLKEDLHGPTDAADGWSSLEGRGTAPAGVTSLLPTIPACDGRPRPRLPSATLT